VEPAATAAVKVTRLPEATEVTAPPEVTANVVDVVAGALLTVRGMEVVAAIAPEVPVTVAIEVPGLAELLAVKVNVLLKVVGFGEKDAVTPVGRPEMARFTLPANPLSGLT
jgi:hypothetical protein